MNFLPNDYEAPRGASLYMRLQDGENKFRILSQPILGWEDWDDKRPIRYKFNEKPAKSIDAKRPVRHFWSMIVWNYSTEQVEILTLTQATVQKQIQAFCQDNDWGAPYFYDIKIMKSGEGKETKYQVNPVPHKPVSQSIVKAFQERPINLNAIFESEDPFARDGTPTPGIFKKEELDTDVELGRVIDKDFAQQLAIKFRTCTAEYKEHIKAYCARIGVKEDFSNLPVEQADKIEKAINRNQDETLLAAVGE